MKVTITFTIYQKDANYLLQILWETIKNILQLADIGKYDMNVED